MSIPQPITLYPQQTDFSSQIAELPQGAGIYCLHMLAGSPPHLAWSTSLQRRLKRMLIGKDEGSQTAAARMRLGIDRIECWPVSSKLESGLVMYRIARQLFPDDYLKRLKLRLPWFIAVVDNDGYPRLTVTNGRGRRYRSVWGPFASRDSAEYYQEEALRLHQVRRCTDPLTPSPGHPGCIYGEMNQCLRPCQNMVSREEYATEFGRLSDFLRTNGKTALTALSSARSAASESLDFEQAALIHKRIEQVKAAAAARDEIVCDLQSFNGIAVTGGPSASEVRLWPMLASIWQEPADLNVSAEQAGAGSLDTELKARLKAAEAAAVAEGDPLEHLGLFLRWYRSTWRDGVWLQCSSFSALNYRKLVREISKTARNRE